MGRWDMYECGVIYGNLLSRNQWVATSVYMLKKELEKRGHNVYVFTTKTPGHQSMNTMYLGFLAFPLP